MAQSRFSRRGDGDNTEEKKGSKLSSIAAKAKEKLGTAAGNIKGVFSKDSDGEKTSRTATAETSFEVPADGGEVPTPSPKFRSRTPEPELTDYTEYPEAPQPRQEQPTTQQEDSQSLPSRWDARSRDSGLYFSERMSDEGFKAKHAPEYEVKKRPAYQGTVIGLSSGYDGDDGTEHYYVPNIDVGNEDRHRRYKKKNRKPLKLWQKGVITGVCITAAFVGLIFLTINLMLIGKMNHIDVSGSGNMNDLYFYEPNMVTSILDDSVSMDQEDRTRLTNLNDAFDLSDLAVKSSKNVQNYLTIALDEEGDADAIVIVSIDSKTKKIRIVNILADLYVPLEKQIGGVSYGSTLRKIYAYGGAKLLCNTVENTLKVSIDNYFVLSFTAFETVVNHLGGADITITEEAISAWMATNKYSAQTRFGGTGRFTLNGEEALIYARMSELDGSFARAQRQQEVLTKLCSRLSEYGTLELVSALYNALSYVTTDCPTSKMLGLCGKLNNYGDYEVKGVTVPIPGTYTEGYVGGEYLLASNITVNANDIQLFLYSNDMTYADGGTEVNVLLPELSEVLDVPEVTVSDSDISATDVQ